MRRGGRGRKRGKDEKDREGEEEKRRRKIGRKKREEGGWRTENEKGELKQQSNLEDCFSTFLFEPLRKVS